MGGLSNGMDGTSGVESACRNLLSSWCLPTDEDAFPTVEDALPTTEEGLPTAEDGGDETFLCGLFTSSPFAWKKTAGFFCESLGGGGCSLGDLTLFAWKNMDEAFFTWAGSGGLWLYMLDNCSRGVGVTLCPWLLIPTVLRGLGFDIAGPL